MRSRIFCLNVLLLVGFAAAAQDGRQWPRNLQSGTVEFSGLLPWPKGMLAEPQQRALIRHWYLAKLTDVTPEERARVATKYGATYDGLATRAYYNQISNTNGEEHFRLVYQVYLKPTVRGLVYKLSNFEYQYYSEDVGTSMSMENLLAHYPSGRPEFPVFQWRLLLALSMW